MRLPLALFVSTHQNTFTPTDESNFEVVSVELLSPDLTLLPAYTRAAATAQAF